MLNKTLAVNFRIAALIILLIGLTSCSSKPETLVEVYDQTEMNLAINRAKSELPVFLEALESKKADSYSVKVPITDSNGTEHFWLTDIVYKDDYFIGKIGNDPGIIANIKFGQEWKVRKDEISDWLYVLGEKIYGGYTIDPLLPSTPKEEADRLRRVLVR